MNQKARIMHRDLPTKQHSAAVPAIRCRACEHCIAAGRCSHWKMHLLYSQVATPLVRVRLSGRCRDRPIETDFCASYLERVCGISSVLLFESRLGYIENNLTQEGFGPSLAEGFCDRLVRTLGHPNLHRLELYAFFFQMEVVPPAFASK
jgi:hypothetical protein